VAVNPALEIAVAALVNAVTAMAAIAQIRRDNRRAFAKVNLRIDRLAKIIRARTRPAPTTS